MIVTITDRVGDGIIEDNALQLNEPDATRGGYSQLRIGKEGVGTPWNAIIKVDLSKFGGAKNIISAYFGFDIYVYYEDIPWDWYEVLVDWEENTSSWNSSSSGVPWDAGGCRGAEDRNSIAEGSDLITGIDPDWHMAISPALVLKWCRESNNGVVIDTSDPTKLFSYIRSSEAAGGPYFYMEYTIDVVSGFWILGRFVHNK